MRFLLHPTTHRATSQGIRKGGTAKRTKESAPSLVSKPAGTAADNQYVQSWGQQCSPNCGCVVRFESTLDPVSKKFTSATYHAKSVIVTQSSQDMGTLQPARTLRTNRPMFRPCSCESLHQLASRVTEYLPNRNAVTFSSSMEFSGVRSSPAFRHTVLEKQGLPTADTHCFDVVEEALTAMVKGHMPKPRKQVPFREAYASSQSSHALHGMGKERGEVEDDQFRIDMATFMTPPRAISALRMLDVTARYSPFGFDKDSVEDDTRYTRRQKQSRAKSKSYDWVTYVDELYERSEDIQKSA